VNDDSIDLGRLDSTPGVVESVVMHDRIVDLWDKGLPPGDKTGWPSVDEFYTVTPGQVTVLTGWPGSGKSEWLDALLVNLSHQGWKIAIFSPENQPLEIHVSKLMEKMAGMPFGAGRNERIPRADLQDLLFAMVSKFGFVRPPLDGALTAKKVIDAASGWLDEFKGQKRGLVIDPWNELEHHRPQGLSETEYISQTLSLVRNWARANSVHVWIVAHPQKMRRDDSGKLPVPRPDMISGSQHWWNKADCAITVWRDLHEPDSQEVEIHVQKVRFKHVGRPGLVNLRYDRVTGRYFEPPRNIYAVERG
jgi:twinkle protein